MFLPRPPSPPSPLPRCQPASTAVYPRKEKQTRLLFVRTMWCTLPPRQRCPSAACSRSTRPRQADQGTTDYSPVYQTKIRANRILALQTEEPGRRMREDPR
jgi:hypothetical protein